MAKFASLRSQLGIVHPGARYGPELLANRDFINWTADDPDDWNVVNESGNDPEVSEVGSGEGQGGSGNESCNFASSGGDFNINQTAMDGSSVYRLVVVCSYVGSGRISAGSAISATLFGLIDSVGTHIFNATSDHINLRLKRTSGATDVTLDSVSLKKVL